MMWTINESNASVVIVSSASAVSCALGALTAHILTKRYMVSKYETLIETEVKEAKAYFSQRNKTGEYADPVALAERILQSQDEEEVAEYKEKVGLYSGTAAKEVIEDLEEEAAEPDPTPVGALGHPGITKPISRPEPTEDMEAFEQRLIDEAKAEVLVKKRRVGIVDDEDDLQHQEEPGDPEEIIKMNVFSGHGTSGDEVLDRSGRLSGKPYIISQDEFNEGEKDYNQNTLTYFDGDDVLADDRDQPIHHQQQIVGTSNLKFGHASGDPNIVYIRNDELEVDFEICRSKGTYTSEVLGYAERERKPKPRKFRMDD